MKHATETALLELADLLAELRLVQGLSERKHGIFYRRGAAFLHFHEDPAGLFADIQSGNGWIRLPANSQPERATVLRTVNNILAR